MIDYRTTYHRMRCLADPKPRSTISANATGGPQRIPPASFLIPSTGTQSVSFSPSEKALTVVSEHTPCGLTSARCSGLHKRWTYTVPNDISLSNDHFLNIRPYFSCGNCTNFQKYIRPFIWSQSCVLSTGASDALTMTQKIVTFSFA